MFIIVALILKKAFHFNFISLTNVGKQALHNINSEFSTWIFMRGEFKTFLLYKLSFLSAIISGVFHLQVELCFHFSLIIRLATYRRRGMAKPYTLLIALMVTFLVIDMMMPVDANLATLQKSWRAMMKQMRQKKRQLPPNLVSVRRLRKRVLAGLYYSWNRTSNDFS